MKCSERVQMKPENDKRLLLNRERTKIFNTFHFIAAVVVRGLFGPQNTADYAFFTPSLHLLRPYACHF